MGKMASMADAAKEPDPNAFDIACLAVRTISFDEFATLKDYQSDKKAASQFVNSETEASADRFTHVNVYPHLMQGDGSGYKFQKKKGECYKSDVDIDKLPLIDRKKLKESYPDLDRDN